MDAQSIAGSLRLGTEVLTSTPPPLRLWTDNSHFDDAIAAMLRFKEEGLTAISVYLIGVRRIMSVIERVNPDVVQPYQLDDDD